MPYVTAADGTELYYTDWGSGRPVVLIHGWPLNSQMWEYQAPVLAANGCRVVAYDRRGFGKSGQPWGGYDYDTLADDLAAVMGALSLEGATLVGYSMGGGEVARYMSRHGGRGVSRAVLLSAVTPFLLKTRENPEGVDQSVFDSILDGLAADRPNFLAGFGKQVFGAGLLNFTVTTEILEWALWMALAGSPRATTECAQAFATTDFRRDMPSFTVPTLVIHGSSDATVPVAASGRKSAAMITGAEYLQYDGAPHATFFNEKDRLNQDLLRFIGS